MFSKLCGQLQDSCEISESDAGDGLFSLVNATISPLLLDYVHQLAFDSRSIFPIPSLLRYLTNREVEYQNAVLIYLAKGIGNWTIPSEDVSHEFVESLTIYITAICTKHAQSVDLEDPQMKKDTNAVGYFLQCLSQTGHATVLLGSEDAGRHKQFQKALINFLALVERVAPWSGLMIRQAYSYWLSNSSNKSASSGYHQEQQQLSSNTPALKLSRVFRLTWLESLMLASGLIQGDEFIQQLDALTVDEPSNVVISELVTTSFDCFAVSLLRKDSPKYFSLWKSFIVKRLPLIIKRLAKDSSILDGIICHTIMALDRGTINLLRISDGGDALDEMFSSFPSTTSDVRQEFLQACIEMDLISPESLSKTLREASKSSAATNPNSVAMVGSDFLLERDGSKIPIYDLLQLAADENPEYVAFEESRIVWLVQKFEELDGLRQERVAKSIPEFLSKCIVMRNMRLLGRFCQALGLNISSLDALVLHMQPSKILMPLVAFLDSWNADDEGNELQQESADFGSIVVATTLVYRRYGLCPEDLGDSSSTVVQLITSKIGTQYGLNDLSEERKELIGGWITALYGTGGISDDLMNQAGFVELVFLVPVIFQQSILACEMGIVDYETLSGGLDYFKQSFLLPTLVGAFEFMTKYIWESKNVAVVLRIIEDLVTSFDGLDGDAKNLGIMVFTCVGEELHDALVKCKAARPDVNVDTLLSVLAPYAVSTGRYGTLDRDSPSLVKTIKDNINILVGWMQSLDQGQVTGPPGYNTSSISMSMQELGSRAVLNIMLDELEDAEHQVTFHYMLDVVSALILAVDSEAQQFMGVKKGARLDMGLLDLVLNEDIESRAKELFTDDVSMGEELATKRGTEGPPASSHVFQKLKQRIEGLRNRFSPPRTDDTTDLFGDDMDWNFLTKA